MKKILLSMRPDGWDRIKSGEKIYEYRKRFLRGEKVQAYLYLSKPLSGISGCLYLGEQISLDSWLEAYSREIDVVCI